MVKRARALGVWFGHGPTGAGTAATLPRPSLSILRGSSSLAIGRGLSGGRPRGYRQKWDGQNLGATLAPTAGAQDEDGTKDESTVCGRTPLRRDRGSPPAHTPLRGIFSRGLTTILADVGAGTTFDRRDRRAPSLLHTSVELLSSIRSPFGTTRFSRASKTACTPSARRAAGTAPCSFRALSPLAIHSPSSIRGRIGGCEAPSPIPSPQPSTLLDVETERLAPLDARGRRWPHRPTPLNEKPGGPGRHPGLRPVLMPNPTAAAGPRPPRSTVSSGNTWRLT